MANATDRPAGDRSRRLRPHSAAGAAALIAVITALTAVAGGLAGAALWWATDRLSKSDVGALQGNGALIVPVLGFPTLLAAGWAALALLARAGHRSPRWLLAPGLALSGLALLAGLGLLSITVGLCGPDVPCGSCTPRGRP